MSQRLLTMRGIGKRFPGVHALKDVHLTLDSGEVVALLGENGAGKSTLINVLSGVFSVYEGDIEFRGRPVVLHAPSDAQRLGIATIHQELNLVPEMSIADNIWLGRERGRAGWLNRSESLERSRAILARVGLSVPPTTLISQLRVAERQLVEVAKALSLDARVLIMDEPTSALADAEVHHLFTTIRKLTSDGVGIIYVSHRLEELEEIADRVNVLRDGQWVGEKTMTDTTRPELIRMMVGHDLSDLPMRAAVATEQQKEPLLVVEDLHLVGDPNTGRSPLHGISFDVRPGEVVGLAGLMGAGRTETLEAIYGGYPSYLIEGRFAVNGESYHPTNPQHAIASGLSLVAEDRKRDSLLLDLSVKFNASLAALNRFLTAGFVRNGAESEVVGAEVRRLGVKTTSINARVGSLSGGNQQKVVLAKCLLTNPSILLLDEPTRGIDVGAKSEIYELVNSLANEGVAVVVASSELSELLRMCDRIVVLCEGRQTAVLDADTATQETILSAAMERTSAIDESLSTTDSHAMEDAKR